MRAGSTATVRIGANLDGDRQRADVELSASGTVITFRGFLAAYEEGHDEERIAKAREEEQERRLPNLSVGCRSTCCGPRRKGTRPRRPHASLRLPW